MRDFAATLFLAFLVVSGCSSDDEQVVQPDPTLMISDSYAPVDTIHCIEGPGVLIFEFEEVRIRGDFLQIELQHILDTVQPSLLAEERLLSVGINSIPRCFRLVYDGRDLSAQTCTVQDTAGNCLGGRYFSFDRVAAGLELHEIGEWSHP